MIYNEHQHYLSGNATTMSMSFAMNSRCTAYIANNPARWDFDRENPAAKTPEPLDVWRE